MWVPEDRTVTGPLARPPEEAGRAGGAGRCLPAPSMQSGWGEGRGGRVRPPVWATGRGLSQGESLCSVWGHGTWEADSEAWFES